MKKTENRFSFLSDYRHVDFSYIKQIIALFGKGRILKDEVYPFQYKKVDYVGFAEDVFVVTSENGKQDLMIGGERCYIDTKNTDASFHCNIAAVFTTSGRLMRCDEVVNKKIKMYHVDVAANILQGNALKYLLHSLPLVVQAKNKTFYDIEQGEQYFRHKTPDRQLEVIFYIRSNEKLVLRKSKKCLAEWRIAAIENEPFEGGKHAAVYRNLRTFRFNAQREPMVTTKPRVYKSSILNLEEVSADKYQACHDYVLSEIDREESLLLRLNYLKSSKIHRDVQGRIFKFSHLEAFLPGLMLEKWVQEGMIDLLSGSRRIELALAIIDALMIVHKRDIIHCDLKPDNILIAEERGKFVARVIDVNASRFSHDRKPNLQNIGSPLFCSPESLEGKVPEFISDVFSIAIVLAEMFGADFSHITSMENVLGLFASKYVFKDLFKNVNGFSEAQKDSIENILLQAVQLDKNKRLTLLELREAFLTLAAGCIPVLPVKKKTSIVEWSVFPVVAREQRQSAGQVSTKKLGF